MKATAVVSIDAIHGRCSFVSIANPCSHAVFGLARISARGNSLRSVVPGGGVARYDRKMMYVPMITVSQSITVVNTVTAANARDPVWVSLESVAGRWSTRSKQLTHHLVGVVVIVRTSKRRDHVDADHVQDGGKDAAEKQAPSCHGL